MSLDNTYKFYQSCQSTHLTLTEYSTSIWNSVYYMTTCMMSCKCENEMSICILNFNHILCNMHRCLRMIVTCNSFQLFYIWPRHSILCNSWIWLRIWPWLWMSLLSKYRVAFHMSMVTWLKVNIAKLLWHPSSMECFRMGISMCWHNSCFQDETKTHANSLVWPCAKCGLLMDWLGN